MVLLTVKNCCDPNATSSFVLPNVDDKCTIEDIKVLIYKKLEDDVDEEGIGSRAKYLYALYMGSMLLEDECELSAYNKSSLNQIAISLYLKNVIKINVLIMPSLNILGCRYAPFLFRIAAKKLEFDMVDQETIFSLKRNIVEALSQYKNGRGEPLQIQHIELAHNRVLVEENLTTLMELNASNPMTFTALIPIGFKRRATD